jgi:hypothetical protein
MRDAGSIAELPGDHLDRITNALVGFENGAISKAELTEELIGTCKNCGHFRSTGADVSGQDGSCWYKGCVISIPDEDEIYDNCPRINDIEEEDDDDDRGWND